MKWVIKKNIQCSAIKSANSLALQSKWLNNKWDALVKRTEINYDEKPHYDYWYEAEKKGAQRKERNIKRKWKRY